MTSPRPAPTADSCDTHTMTCTRTPVWRLRLHDPADPRRTEAPRAWHHACHLHVHQVGTRLLDGERGDLDLRRILTDEGRYDTLRRYRERTG